MEDADDVEMVVVVVVIDDFDVAKTRDDGAGAGSRGGDEPRGGCGTDESVGNAGATGDPSVDGALVDDVLEIDARGGGGEAELVDGVDEIGEARAARREEIEGGADGVHVGGVV